MKLPDVVSRNCKLKRVGTKISQNCPIVEKSRQEILRFNRLVTNCIIQWTICRITFTAKYDKIYDLLIFRSIILPI
jgi:hypothetical protein